MSVVKLAVDVDTCLDNVGAGEATAGDRWPAELRGFVWNNAEERTAQRHCRRGVYVDKATLKGSIALCGLVVWW